MQVRERKTPLLVHLEAQVDQVVRETPDTVTLILRSKDGPFGYKAGQFINIDVHQFDTLKDAAGALAAEKGKKEPARAYSLASAPHEPNLAITVKEEPFTEGVHKHRPLLSPYLVRDPQVGLPIRALGFLGPYVLPDDIEEKTDHLVHLVAGSGSVPNFSILKDALHRRLRLRHTFLYSNKTWDDVCFREPLFALGKQYPDKLKVVHTLTRETNETCFGSSCRRGRITQEVLEEFVPDIKSAFIFACGPAITPWDRRESLVSGTRATPRFMETVIGHLHAMGVPDKQIKRETYG